MVADPRQLLTESRCSECGKQRGIKWFEGYFKIPKQDRQYYQIDQLMLCDECIALSHRPRRLRELAGVVQAKRSVPDYVKQAEADETLGMTSKQKKVWRQEQKKLRQRKHIAKPTPHQPRMVAAPILAAKEVGATQVSVQREVAPAPAAQPDAYPNVLPLGATFIPKGFVKGEHTGLIIRKDPNDPKMEPEIKCFAHSEIQGQDVYHPHWDFYRDKSRPTGCKPNCKELNRSSTETRAELAKTWREEHSIQLSEGRRMAAQEADELHAAAQAAEKDEPIATPGPRDQLFPLGATIGSDVLLDLVEKLGDPALLSARLPVNHSFLADALVTLPEGFTAGTGDPGYLDLELNPPDLAEIQRAGLFMLTQLSQVMVSWRDLQLLRRKYNELQGLAREADQQLERAQVVMREIESARDRFKEQATEARAALLPTQQQLQTLQAEYEQLKQKADLDHDTLVLTEESNTALSDQLKKLERVMKPFLGGRTIVQFLADAE